MEANPHQGHTCKSCGHFFFGSYCNLCGEKVIEPKDREFKFFLSGVLIATTIVDNKFIKTLWLIIKNPGFLSKEYVEGIRIKYMRPLQLFFILNLIYFLFPTLQLFNSSLYTQMHVLPHREIVRKAVVRKLTEGNMTLDGFTVLYNSKTIALAKLLMVVFVLLSALPLSVIFRRNNRYFTDHTAFAVELTSFNLAVNAIGLSLVLWMLSPFLIWVHPGWEKSINDLSLTIIFIVANLYFLFRASKTFYLQQGKWMAVKAVLGIAGVFLTLEIYRFILFYITLWTL